MSDPNHIKPTGKTSEEKKPPQVNAFSVQKFNFHQKENVDFSSVVQIIDIRKNSTRPLFGASSSNKKFENGEGNAEGDWKFNMILQDELPTCARKRVWTNELDKLGGKKRELLRKFKKSCDMLNDNETMRELSQNKLELIREYCLQNDIDVEHSVAPENLSQKAKSVKQQENSVILKSASKIDKDRSASKERSVSKDRASIGAEKVNNVKNIINNKKKTVSAISIDQTCNQDKHNGKRSYTDMLEDFLFIEFHDYVTGLKKTIMDHSVYSKQNA